MFRRISKSIRSRVQGWRVRKRVAKKNRYQAANDLGQPKGVVWIFGCQRSGTTFLENLFRHDLRSAVYGEFSDLSLPGRTTVLQDLQNVKRIVDAQNAEYAVIRPLFESDRFPELLSLFPNAVGVWMYRDAQSVVDSMYRKWGREFFEISRKVESVNNKWRLESLARRLQSSIDSDSTKNSTCEAYAQYWIARNRIPFDQDNCPSPALRYVSYRELVEDPKQVVGKILEEIGVECWKDFAATPKLHNRESPEPTKLSHDTSLEVDQLYELLGHVNSPSHN